MNSLYIAVTRIVRQGIFIEAGDPSKNELHRRLHACITKTMHDIHLPKEPTLDLKAVLAKAEQDLLEGKLLQAKAGYLRAGKTEDDFEAAVQANHRTNEAIVKSMIHARSQAKTQSKSVDPEINPLSAQTIKDFDDIIKTNNKSKLIKTLKSLGNIASLLNVVNPAHPTRPTYLAHLLFHKRLRTVLIEHLSRNKDALLKIAKHLDWNAAVLQNDTKSDETTIPLILDLTLSNEGLKFIDLLLNSKETDIFTGLKIETLMRSIQISSLQANGMKAKISLGTHTIEQIPKLFIKLIERNPQLAQGKMIDHWLKPLDPSELYLNVNHVSVLTWQIIRSKSPIKDKLYQVFHSILEELTKSLSNEQKEDRLFKENPISIFDLMLTDPLFTPTIALIIKSHMSVMTPQFITGEINIKVAEEKKYWQMVTRIKQLMEVHNLSELGRVLIDGMKSNPDFKESYSELSKKYFPSPEIRTDPSLQTSSTKMSEDGPTYVDMLNLLTNKAEVKKLGSVNHNPDGTTSKKLISLLQDQRNQNAIIKIMAAPKTIITAVAQENLINLLSNIKLESMTQYRDNNKKVHEVPTWFYMLDNFNNFIAPYLHLMFDGLVNKHKIDLLTKPFHSVIFNCELNLVTYTLLVEPNTLVNISKFSSQLFRHIQWDTYYKNDPTSYHSALLSIARMKNKADATQVMDIIRKNSDTFLNSLSPERLLNPPCGVMPRKLTQLDNLLSHTTNNELASLLIRKLSLESKSRDFFNLGSLSEPIEFDALDEDEQPIVLTMTRLHLILLKEVPIGELTSTLKESENLDLWIDLLVSNPVITKQTIIKYQWNALSSLISSMRLVEMLSLLVSLNPERLRNLPDNIWHAPITNETAGHLPVKNYALMTLLIRTHGNDPIGEYFKTHYKDIHQLALNYNGFYYYSDDEISALNQVNLNHLNPSRLIESEDTDLLKSHLLDPKMHQHFRLVFKEYPIIDWIMKSQKLRDCLFNFFTEDHGLSIKRLLSEFMQAIDINHVISVEPYKGKPLLHVVYTHNLGKRLINDMLQFDARTFIQSLNFNTLAEEMATKEDNKVKLNQPFLNIFIFSNYLRMLNFFRYSLITRELLEHIIMKTQNILFETKVFVNKITNELLSTEVSNELAKLLIESLCLLFETMPSIVTCPEAQNMDIFSNAQLKYKVFSSSSNLIDSSARNRLLHALQPNANLLNRLMIEFKLAQPTFPEIMPMRQLQLHGLHEAQKIFYLGFLELDNQAVLAGLLATSEGPSALPHPLSDGKPLILHLLEHKTLRSVTIKAIHDQLSNSTNMSYASLFTEKLLTSNITRDGHQIPLLFDLAQCSQGSELLKTISANSANNFYSAFGCELFTMPFYSVDYQQMTTLCLVFSIKDIASLYEVLDTKENLIKNVSSDFWTKTQSLGSSQVSIVGNLLNSTEANRVNASLCVTYLLLATENGSDTTPNNIYHWFKKTLKTSNEEFGIFSLFDLLAYNEYNRGILTMFLIKHPIPLNYLLTEIVIPTGSILPLELIHRIPEAAEALRIGYMDETIALESRNDFINHASEMLLKTHDPMEPGLFSIFKHRLTYLTMQCSGSKTILSLLQILPELADRLNFSEPMTPEYKLMLDTFLVGILPSHTHAFKQLKPYLDRNKAFNAYLTHFEREINERSEALLKLTNDASTIEEDTDEALTRNALTWLYLLKLKPRCQFHNNPQKNEDFLNAAIRKKCFIYALSLFFSAYTKEERCISMSNLFKKLHLHQYIVSKTNQVIPLISHFLNCYANSFLSADLPYALYKLEASPYYSPKADYTEWTTPAYSLTTEISSSAPSHLDILMMETRLVDIANEFIKTHLAQFIGHYLTMDNLFTPFNTPDGDKIRAELLLKQPQFHNYFIIALRKAKNIPVISLANLLNGNCKNHSSEMVPDTHLVMQLYKTEHGRLLLKECFKNKVLMDLLDKRLRDIITTVAEPPEASVANQGFFAQGAPTISVTSADEMINFIKKLPG